MQWEKKHNSKIKTLLTRGAVKFRMRTDRRVVRDYQSATTKYGSHHCVLRDLEDGREEMDG